MGKNFGHLLLPVVFLGLTALASCSPSNSSVQSNGLVTVTCDFALGQAASLGAASLCRIKVSVAGNDQINVAKSLGQASLDDIKALDGSLNTIFDGEYEYVTVQGTERISRDDYFTWALAPSEAFTYLLAVKSGEQAFYLGYYIANASYYYTAFVSYDGHFYFRGNSPEAKAALTTDHPLLEAKGYGGAIYQDIGKNQTAFIAAVFPF